MLCPPWGLFIGICFIHKAVQGVEGHIKIEVRLLAFQELITYLKKRAHLLKGVADLFCFL